MHIIVYNPYCSDAVEDSRKVIGMLIERFGAAAVKFHSRSRLTIDIFDTRIDFWHGELCKMAGVNPDYYVAWNINAVEFLECAASRVNGKRLGSLDDIGRVIFEHYRAVTEVSSGHEEA